MPANLDPARMIRELSRPRAFPGAVGSVQVEQTHISVVFLTESHAYKIKKSLDLGFLDFTTLAKRKHFCEEEVRLNRPRAPGVYLGVVPVTDSPRGLEFEGSGEAVEWAVKMERLPRDHTLRSRLHRGEVTVGMMERVAERVAELHRSAERGPQLERFGSFDTVAFNARENFQQSEDQVGITVSAPVFQRFRTLTEEHLARLEPSIRQRAARGMTRDTHGDLHLDHVYLFPRRDPPRDLLIVDCIEFNDRFRYADPMADVGFLAMDLVYHGRRDLSRALMEAYFAHADDPGGRALQSFYVAYRAAVRGKVEGMAALQESVPEASREEARERSRAHWMVGLGALEDPSRRPCLILVSGLPGTGKTSVAEALAAMGGGEVVSSDRIRKRLAGLDPLESARDRFEAGLYSPEMTSRTYAECLAEAGRRVLDGSRVIVDATFRTAEHRRSFFEAARGWGVPCVLIHCQADPATVRRRMSARSGDASDAYWGVYESMAERWEGFEEDTDRNRIRCDTDRPMEEIVAGIRAGLSRLGLWSSPGGPPD